MFPAQMKQRVAADVLPELRSFDASELHSVIHSPSEANYFDNNKRTLGHHHFCKRNIKWSLQRINNRIMKVPLGGIRSGKRISEHSIS